MNARFISLPPILQQYPLSAAQRAAVLTRDEDVVVTAGAGTGKTRTLVARYLSLLAEERPLRHIVAVTFTRKAAREMRNRVRGLVGAYLATDLPLPEQLKWQQLYQELDAARIGTIHNLCGEILRAHPAEARLDPRFTVLDENISALLLQEAVEIALARGVGSDSLMMAEGKGALPEMGQLFRLLSERAVQNLISRMLSQRPAVEEIVARIPAAEIGVRWKEQLAALQVEAIGAFLSDPVVIDARKTLEQTPAINRDDRLAIQQQATVELLARLPAEETAVQLQLMAALAEIDLRPGSQKSWPGGKDDVSAVKTALRRLRGRYQETPHFTWHYNAVDQTLAATMAAIYALFHHAHAAYTALKMEREAVDFDDLEGRAILLLAEYPAICRYWQEQTAALLVDEFQDTNSRQRRLLRLLCPQPGKLFIVGDAKQSIYRFRGADVTVFASEKQAIEAAGGELIDLHTSYRAHADLLAGMNRLLGPILGEDNAHRPAYKAPFAPLRPAQVQVHHGLAAPYVEFHLGAGNKEVGLAQAAAGLAGRLAELGRTSRIPYGKMAILCRASNAFRFYEDALDAAGIPYVTVAGKGFYGRPEIRDLFNALQTIADPHNDLALAGLLRSPAIGLSDETLYRLFLNRLPDHSMWAQLRDAGAAPALEHAEAERLERALALIDDLHRLVGRVRVADVLKEFLDRTNYRAILNLLGQPRALRNVDKLMADIHESGQVPVDAFLELMAMLRDSGTREGEARAAETGAVRIMSIHAAKGLEFPVVVLGDAGSSPGGSGGPRFDPDWGILLPVRGEDEQKAASSLAGEWLSGQKDEAEADRLLYVALTRAEQILLISGHFYPRKSGAFSFKGWLGQLAAETGLAGVVFESYDAEGSGLHHWEGMMGETAVRAVLPEPNHQFAPTVGTAETETMNLTISTSGLQAPLSTVASVETGEQPRQVWRVVPDTRRPTAPAWLIGQLVHEALAQWRFPDAQYAGWVRTRARELGLIADEEVTHAMRDSSRLLHGFQQSALYREIAAAELRRHELPYIMPSVMGEEAERDGKIDLLYRLGERWVIVDFKTDRLRDAAEMARQTEEQGYGDQIRRYGRAIQTLVGLTPTLLLCFLNVGGQVRVLTVEQDWADE